MVEFEIQICRPDGTLSLDMFVAASSVHQARVMAGEILTAELPTATIWRDGEQVEKICRLKLRAAS